MGDMTAPKSEAKSSGLPPGGSYHSTRYLKTQQEMEEMKFCSWSILFVFIFTSL